MASLEQYFSWFIQNLKILRKKEFWVAFLSFLGAYGFINYVFAFISRTILITVNMLIFVMGLIVPTLIFAIDQWRQRKKTKMPLPPPPIEATTKICPTCNKPMIYVKQYDKWYCQKCGYS